MRMVAALAAAIACAFTGAAQAETYRLNYEAAVLGVVVLGTVSYEVTANQNRYAVRANVRTSGLARLFDQTEINAATSGAVGANGLTWSRYDLSHAYAGKFRRTQLTRTGAGVEAQISPNYSNMGEPPASGAQRASSSDPLTAVFGLGRQIGAARACRAAVLVFDGRQHYRLAVSPIAQVEFSGGGYTGPALRCQLRYEPIAGFNMTAQERSRIPAGEAWFALPAQAEFAAPLRLTVPTPLGSAVLDLRGYERRD